MAGTRHYGWVIFGPSFANLLAEGGIKNTVPVVYVALRDSFRWSAAATAGIFSLGGLTGAMCAPLLGRLLDRIGPRYLFPLGGLLILIGYLSSSWVTELWQLYLLYGILATLGQNAISSFTTAAILSPWFPRNRGRMLGLADAGNRGQVGGDGGFFDSDHHARCPPGTADTPPPIRMAPGDRPPPGNDGQSSHPGPYRCLLHHGGLVVGAKAADLFPTRVLGSVIGLVQMGRGLGIMVGPLQGGLLFDLQGNYIVAYLLAVALVCGAIGCVWGARLAGLQAVD